MEASPVSVNGFAVCVEITAPVVALSNLTELAPAEFQPTLILLTVLLRLVVVGTAGRNATALTGAV